MFITVDLLIPLLGINPEEIVYNRDKFFGTMMFMKVLLKMVKIRNIDRNNIDIQQEGEFVSPDFRWILYHWASPVAQLVKNLPANVEDTRDTSTIPGSGRSSGEGNGNPLQYSCLENSMDRGTWRVQGVARSQT